MNIMFMTKFPDGKETNFKKKIIYAPNFYYNNEDSDFWKDERVRLDLLSGLDVKLHTLRQSKRVKVGMWLSLRNWSGKPYRSTQVQFAGCFCKGTQDIVIFRVHKKLRVWVDGFLLNDSLITELALNDGFDSPEHFCEYFQKGFIGQIIHWTNMKY
jgi:hypothetical protein